MIAPLAFGGALSNDPAWARERTIMHEMSLVMDMREIIEAAVKDQQVKAITRVRLELGAFSCVEPEALRFAWDAVMAGTVADGAHLEMQVMPGRAYCYDCARSVALPARLAPCPECGGTSLLPEGGDDLRIKDLEVT